MRAPSGLTANVYTTRNWSNDEVETLARQYRIELVVLFTSITPRESNEFFDALIADQADEALPQWLTPVLATTNLRLYRVESTASHLSMATDR